MNIKFKISCPCFCSYCVSDGISEKEIRCPNCGRVPSFSEKLVQLLNIAKEIPYNERFEDGHEMSIRVLSFSEELKDV